MYPELAVAVDFQSPPAEAKAPTARWVAPTDYIVVIVRVIFIIIGVCMYIYIYIYMYIERERDIHTY